MIKIKIRHYASATIIESTKTNEFLFNEYNKTYRVKCLRGKLNLIGGNYEIGDNSPLDILKREIAEEFSMTKQEKNLFALNRDIIFIRNSILRNITPYKDYLLTVPPIEGTTYKALYSIFISKIPQDIFECARRNILNKKRIINEGLATICNTPDLVVGKLLTAWATGFVIGDYKNVTMPNSQGSITEISILDKPKKSFKKYLNKFEYIKKK